MFVREECKGHKKVALPSFAFMVYFFQLPAASVTFTVLPW